jgi:hypothetical protein|uniref:Uncharacterized protein n=1 Tax=Zea mays TaxID=4577 RepID=A0A804NCJ4_MAIZE
MYHSGTGGGNTRAAGPAAGGAQLKRYPTAATASVPAASAGPVTAAAAAPVELAGDGPGASDAVATPTSDEATTAAVAAAARILSLRVAAISLASYLLGRCSRDGGEERRSRKLASRAVLEWGRAGGRGRAYISKLVEGALFSLGNEDGL